MSRPQPFLVGTNHSINLDDRHPSVAAVAQYFQHAHLSEDLQKISLPFASLAVDMLFTLPDGPELTVGLRKLLEAKDCFVRTAVAAR